MHSSVKLKGGDMQKYRLFFMSLLNFTTDEKRVVKLKNIYIYNIRRCFRGENAFEKSLRPTLIFLFGCGQI